METDVALPGLRLVGSPLAMVAGSGRDHKGVHVVLAAGLVARLGLWIVLAEVLCVGKAVDDVPGGPRA